MGKKRQRCTANDAEAKKHTLQELPQLEPTTPSSTEPNKKHKKAPMKLKVIGVKAPTVPAPKIGKGGNEPQAKAAEMNAPEDESSKQKKKKKPKKSKSKSKSQANASGNDLDASGSKQAKDSAEDIDDLFRSLKSKKKENAAAAEREKAEAAQIRKKQRMEREQLEEQIKLLEAQNTNLTAVQGKNPDPRPVRYDEDGLPIYSEEALQIGKGGDTAECPFDCWCCF